jgi:FkbM family methyltransferase
MLLAFHNAFSSKRIAGAAVDFVLPTLAKHLQGGFCRFVDGGAGIGGTAVEYDKVLEANLDEANAGSATVTCYEPLAENFAELSQRLADHTRCRLRNVAVANANGKTAFIVPSRQAGNAAHWGAGTSYNGFVNDNRPDPGYEKVDVDMVRIEDDVSEPQDFVKLDLQGGELEAIKGMGSLLKDAKVLYVETQLLADEKACDYLSENGYAIFFDKFQFGLLPGRNDVPLKQLGKLGISIDRIFLPGTSGLPLIFWGYMEAGRDRFDGFSFSHETRKELKAVGVEYFQTDALCVNTRFSDQIFPLFNAVI